MDKCEQFKGEMESLLQPGLSLTKNKLDRLVHIATNSTENAHRIVESLKRFAEKCPAEAKYTALCIIDSILQNSRHKYGSQDIYTPLFANDIQILTTNLFLSCCQDDKAKFVNILTKWERENTFSLKVIQPLLQMVNAYVSILKNQQTSLDIEQVNQTSSSAHNNGNNTPTQDDSPYYYEYLSSKRNNVENDFQSNNSFVNAPLTTTESSYIQTDLPEGVFFPNEHKEWINNCYPNFSSDYDMSQLGTGSYSYLGQPQSRMTGEHFHRSEHRHNSSFRFEFHREYPSPSSRKHRQDRTNRIRSRSRSPTLSRTSRYNEPDLGRNRKEPWKRSIPPAKVDHLTVCSTTLWVGNLPTTFKKSHLYEIFINFGEVHSIVYVREKFCAFVCMKRRDVANYAYDHLLASNELRRRFNQDIKLAWAPGKGVKTLSKYNDYWNFHSGCAFVPHDAIRSNNDLAVLREGSFIDKSTIPANLEDSNSSLEEVAQPDSTGQN